MVKAIRRIVFSLAVVVFVVAGIIAFRTTLYRSRQITPATGAAALQLQASAVERFAAAIQFKTISGRDGDFRALTRPLAEKLSENTSLLYTQQGRDRNLKPILLMGHMDVVPVEPDSEKKWSHPPFAGRIVDGYIWGRGTMDDKVNVLGALEAVKLLLAQGFQPQRTIYLAFGHDEKVSGQRGAAKIAALLGQRNVKLDFVLDEGSVITDGIIPGVTAPVAAVGIAEKGYFNLQLTVDAPGGHSSMPPASTAIGILSRAVDKMERTPFPARIDGAMEEFFAFVGPEMSWIRRAVLANRWLFGAWLKRELANSPLTATLIRTTQAATLFYAGVKGGPLPTFSSSA